MNENDKRVQWVILKTFKDGMGIGDGGGSRLGRAIGEFQEGGGRAVIGYLF